MLLRRILASSPVTAAPAPLHSPLTALRARSLPSPPPSPPSLREAARSRSSRAVLRGEAGGRGEVAGLVKSTPAWLCLEASSLGKRLGQYQRCTAIPKESTERTQNNFVD